MLSPGEVGGSDENRTPRINGNAPPPEMDDRPRAPPSPTKQRGLAESRSSSIALELNLTEEEAHQIAQPTVQELVVGVNVYIKGHGPAMVVEVLEPSEQAYRVQYPDLSKSRVSLVDILFVDAALRNPDSSQQGRRGSKTRQTSPRVSPSSPRLNDRRMTVEFLGAPFDCPSRQTNSPSAVFSLIATMVGGGVLSLPYAVSNCGILLGGITLLLSAAASTWTFEMLVDCARRTGRDSFQLVAQTAVGAAARQASIYLVVLTCWGGIIAYAVLVGDLLVPTVQFMASADKPPVARQWLILASAIAISPFIFQKSLSALRFLCFASVSSVCIVTVIIGYRAFVTYGDSHDVYWINPQSNEVHAALRPAIRMLPRNWGDALYCAPMFGVSFLCHFNALPAHLELARPTRWRIRRVFILTMSCTAVLYGLIGNFGYIYAGDHTCDNILLNFAANDKLAMIARCALAFVLTFNFPLLIFPAREALYTGYLSAKAAWAPAPSPPLLEDSTSASARTRSGSGQNVSPGASSRSLPRVHVYLADSDQRHAMASPVDVFEPKDEISGVGADMPVAVRVFLTIAIFGSAMVMACALKSVMIVWTILGSTCSLLIACIFPSLFWLRLAGPSQPPGIVFLARGLLGFTIALGVTCTLLSAVKLVSGQSPACPVLLSEYEASLIMPTLLTNGTAYAAAVPI